MQYNPESVKAGDTVYFGKYEQDGNKENGKDKKKIIITTVENKDNKKYGTKGGNTTKDKVFLLSIDEAYKYYKTDKERTANITEYALGEAKRIGLEKGWWESEQEFNDWWEEHKSDYGWQWWYWLRSPGRNLYDAAIVHCDGSVLEDGYSVSSFLDGGRPALWVVL